MNLQTEPIGSIPRPQYLVDAMQAFARDLIKESELSLLMDDAVRDTIKRFEGTGSPVITDGEQSKPSFATYPISGLKSLSLLVLSFLSRMAIQGNYQKLQQGHFIIPLMLMPF